MSEEGVEEARDQGSKEAARKNMAPRYETRLRRYVTALRGGTPDCVPIRPFAAEFAAKYAGYTCAQVTHDTELAFAAVRRCAADFDWDAVVGNMVYVWGGLTEALGLRYYALPGLQIPSDVAFQYLEPPPEQAFMRPDEYDALIADPTAFLYETWLPRVSREFVAPEQPGTRRHSVALVKAGMAMLQYFYAFGPQAARLRDECGTVSAIAGILKAPLDILADKLRGYLGLTRDLRTQPDQVLRACEALAPHLLRIALDSADPAGQVPVGFWMHRGCVPFVTPAQFESHYWPTLRPIIESLWAAGHQTLFYAEGDWNRHLDRFVELPTGSIVYHVDRGDLADAHRKLGGRFCLSGGVPNTVLAFGTPDEVRAECRRVIDTAGRGGGYVMDASAIIQNDARVENMQALTEFAREYGVYGTGHLGREGIKGSRDQGIKEHGSKGAPAEPAAPVCVPWSERRAELQAVAQGEELVRRIWEQVDALGHTFIWHCLVSF